MPPSSYHVDWSVRHPFTKDVIALSGKQGFDFLQFNIIYHNSTSLEIKHVLLKNWTLFVPPDHRHWLANALLTYLIRGEEFDELPFHEIRNGDSIKIILNPNICHKQITLELWTDSWDEEVDALELEKGRALTTEEMPAVPRLPFKFINDESLFRTHFRRLEEALRMHDSNFPKNQMDVYRYPPPNQPLDDSLYIGTLWDEGISMYDKISSGQVYVIKRVSKRTPWFFNKQGVA